MTAVPAGRQSLTAWSGHAWAIYLGWVVITLDGSALNLALPAIARDLHAGPGGLPWVVDAYILPLASLLLLGGTLGDRIGTARLFRIGAIGFAVASIACALAPTMVLLIAFRALQGVFAAALLPMVLALLGTSFSDRAEQTRAVNLMTVFGGAGIAVGPFLGGLLTDTIGWRAVFWLTVPLAAAAALLVVAQQRRGESRDRPRVDVLGQVTGTAGLVLLVAGLVEVSRHAGTDILSWALLVAGAIILVGFVLIERRVSAPMMPLSVFGNPEFRRAVAGGFAFQLGAYGLQFFLAVYIQRAWGVSAVLGGLLLAPFAIGIVLASALLNPPLLKRGHRVMVITGTAISAVGTIALLFLAGERQWALLAVACFVIGAGTGIYSTALNQVAAGALGAESSGLASGIYNTSRQVGQSVGIAVLGALAVLSAARLGFVIAIVLVTACSLLILGGELRSRRSSAAG
jgi:DHA2 family methylenomycin A resistance protein-like MFS transporter